MLTMAKVRPTSRGQHSRRRVFVLELEGHAQDNNLRDQAGGEGFGADEVDKSKEKVQKVLLSSVKAWGKRGYLPETRLCPASTFSR